MKRYLLLLLITITTSTIFAQTNFRFADSTAQWNVLEVGNALWCGCYDYQTTVYQVTTDTFINGHFYQKINQHFFIRQDSIQKVFIRTSSDTSEKLSYDFSKLPNDTFTVNNIGGSISCRVDSIDTVMLDHPRKRMYVTYNDLSYGQVIWVEGIGCINGNFLNPGYEYMLWDGPGWTLLCYSQEGNLVYHDNYFQNCIIDTTIWLGIREYSISEIHIFPNPTTNFITIQSQTNFPSQTTFHLFDITGRMILQKQLTDKTTQVELDEVSKGIYLYNITALEKKMGSGKLVVQ